MRYREQVTIRPGIRTTVGVWKPGEVPEALRDHLAGPTLLLSELANHPEWRLRRRDQPSGRDEPLDGDLIIMLAHAGNRFTEQERKQLAAFLDVGGVLLVEACVAAGLEDARRAMETIVQACGGGRVPRPVDRNHPLLTTRHVFSAPPPGASAGQLLEDGGLVLCGADYSCAWNGGSPDKPLPRPDIRSAVEFAENILAYAQVRRLNAVRAQRLAQTRSPVPGQDHGSAQSLAQQK